MKLFNPQEDGGEAAGAPSPTAAAVASDDAHSVAGSESSSGKGSQFQSNDDYKNQADLANIQKPITAYVGVMLLCLMIAFGGYVFGWDTGTISGFVNQTDFLRRFGSTHKDGTHYMSNARTGLVVSIFNVGCAIGGLVLGKLADLYGRRLALIIVTIIYMVGLVICIASIDKWYQYFIGRIIEGLGVGGIAVLAPLMLGEISPKQIRAICVSFYQLMITLGIFLGYCTNYGTKKYHNSRQWRIPLGLGFAWALFMILGMLFVPESPRYLIERGKIDEAKVALGRVNKVSADDPAIQYEVDEISAAIEAERLAGSASWTELLSVKTKVFQRVFMAVMLQSLQQLTGDNYFFYYGTSIFKAVGLKDSFETSIIMGVVNLFSTFVCLWVVQRFGRRTCLLWGAGTMVCCMVVYASVGVKRLYPHGRSRDASKGAGNCMICFTMFFIFCFATTWAPLPYVIGAESFPIRVRSKGIAVATGANWIWGFLIGFFTPFINTAIHYSYGYVFMGCLVFSFFFVFFYVPETKGLSLEEVEEMWQEGVLPWKSASWVPPSQRGADYNVDELKHDDRVWYKKMF